MFFALRYVKDLEIAEEITQEVFLGLWEKRATIDLSKSVRSYVTTSVKNKSLNYLRDTRKFNREILAIEGLIDEVEIIHSDRMIEAELKNRIRESLDELPEKCREIFILSRHENLKYQEIAERQQISVKTVETQMSKALQHFRIRLADYLPVLILWVIALWK